MLTIDSARERISECQAELGYKLTRGEAFDLLCDQFPKADIRDVSDVIKRLYNA